jgi:hypothetical protein
VAAEGIVTLAALVWFVVLPLAFDVLVWLAGWSP